MNDCPLDGSIEENAQAALARGMSFARVWVVISGARSCLRGGCPDSAVRAARSARFFRDGLTVCAALSIRGCRIGDRIRQRFGETAVAPVVHMQAIRREKYLERDAVDVVPVPHEGEAAKHVDVPLLGRARNELDHVCNFRLCDHLRANWGSIK